jgi:hypothetical protein
MSVRLATVKITGVTPYSQSAYVPDTRGDNEPHDDYERRTVGQKAHFNESTGEIFIPGMAFKWSIQAAAQYLGISVPGKGKTKFGSIFGPAVTVLSDVNIGHNIKDVSPDDKKTKTKAKNAKWYLMNSDGRRGSGSRVPRIFPEWDKWEGTIQFMVTDPAITEEIFEKHIKAAGDYIGVGRFRPQKPTFGTYGKFHVDKISWKEVEGEMTSDATEENEAA